jgi:hypothetical protein
VPFTLAHPAAVLPLRGLGLPMTALVAGSMAPDLPQMLGVADGRTISHSAAAVVTVDLAIGVVAVVLWYALYRRPLVDLAPDRWRARLPDRVRLTPVEWALCVPGVVIGAATHVAWDSFTHEDSWGTEHVALLRESFLGLPAYEWAQHLCSVLGLAAVVAVSLRYLSRLPEQPPRPGPLVARWALVVALAWGGLLGMGIAVLVWPWGLEAMAYYGVITTMLVAGFGATCVCVWWQVKHRWRTRRGTRATAGSSPQE